MLLFLEFVINRWAVYVKYKIPEPIPTDFDAEFLQSPKIYSFMV